MQRTRKKSVNVGSFNPSDYYSSNGFLTDIWGPSMWLVLHTISFNYPCSPTPTQRKQYRLFFDSLKHVLPCGKCRTNLNDNFNCTTYGPHVFKNRETLSRWVYDLHSCVNRMLKKDTPYSFESTRTRFENFRARCREPSSKKRDTRRAEKEDGCTDPVNGRRSKCMLTIKPLEECTSCETMKIDDRCLCHVPAEGTA